MKASAVFFLLSLNFFLMDTTAISATIGDFRTKMSGNWNQVSIWQYYNGSTWINATWAPTYTDDDIDILSGHTITVTAPVTIDQTSVAGILNINSGVTLTVNDGSSTDLSVSNRVNVYGTLVNKGLISSDPTEIIVYTGALYQHNRDGGSVADATWNDGSTCEITGILSSTSLTNTDQSFYHFKWNCSSQTSDCNLAGNLTTIRGNFTMAASNTGKLQMAASADYTCTISGDWLQQAGTFSLGGGSSYALISLKGNFSMTGGKITEENSSGYYARISFSKTGTQTYTKSAGVFENNIDFEIVSGTALDMGESVADGSLGQFAVNSGSTLKTSHAGGISGSGASGCIQTASRYYSLAANYHYSRLGAQATGNGIPSPLNGKMIIGSTSAATNLTLTNGAITIAGSLNLCSSGLANSSIVSGTVSYGSTGTLEYTGASAQTTTNKEWPTLSPPYHVNIGNSSGVSMDNDRSIAGTLTLTNGPFSIGARTLTLNGSLVKTSGYLNGGSSSAIVAGGSSPTALDLPTVTLGNLTLARGSGLRLTGSVTIYGAMTMTLGAVSLMPSQVFIYMPGSRLVYNGSVNQTTSAEEFPVLNGPPSLETAKPAGTTLNLTFNRTLTENLYLTGGTFAIGANTLTIQGLIIRTSGEMTGGGSSNLAFTGSAAAAMLPAIVLQNLTINRPAGIQLEGTVTTGGTLVLTLGPLNLDAYTLNLNGNILFTTGTITGGPLSSLFIGPAPGAVNLPVTTAGTVRIERNDGVTLGGNLQAETALNLVAGDLLLGNRKLTLNGDLNLSGGTLTGSLSSALVAGGSGSTLMIPPLTLATLTLSRSNGLLFQGDVTIGSAMTLNSGTCYLNGNTLWMNGTIVYNGGNLAGNSLSKMMIGGTGPLFDLAPITLHTLQMARMGILNLTGDITILQQFTLIMGNVLRNGHLMYGSSATLRYQGMSPQFTTDEEFPETNGPAHLVIANPTEVMLHSDRSLSGNIELQAGNLNLGGFGFTLGGTITSISGTLNYATPGGSITFAPGPLPAELPNAGLTNLTIDRAAGVTTHDSVFIYDTLSITSGDLAIGSGSTLCFFGEPIAGNRANLKGGPLSSILLHNGNGNNPIILPSSLTILNNLTILSGTAIFEGNLQIEGELMSAGGTLHMGSWEVSGPGALDLYYGSILSGHSAGIQGNFQCTGPQQVDGNINYIFNGPADQVTGFLPTTPPGMAHNVRIEVPAPVTVTLDSDLHATGDVVVEPGGNFLIPAENLLEVDGSLVLEEQVPGD